MTIQIIYAGGTFGSYGSPLKPIRAEIFIPKLQELIFESGLGRMDIANNITVKDSSEFSAIDFVKFYQLILKSYSKGCKQFIFITGTDTLSYLGAFLAEAFVNSDICIAITASMKPLLESNEAELIVNKNSDAWHNLKLAIAIVKQGHSGVRTCIQSESWNAETVKKMHSHELKAFKGNYTEGYPINTYHTHKDTKAKNEWLQERFELLPFMEKRATNFNITPIFLMPNNQQWLAHHISTVVESIEKSNEVTYLILMSYGAGNLPFSDELCKLFDAMIAHGHIIISSSQCAFGGVSDEYESGSWQYEHGVLSGGNISIELIFARLYWLHLKLGTKNPQIKVHWNKLLTSS